MKKLLAATLVALSMLFAAFATTTEPALALDGCEGICVIEEDPCAGATTHNWKQCGEDPSDTIDGVWDRDEPTRNNDEAPDPVRPGNDDESDIRHNWKLTVLPAEVPDSDSNDDSI